MEIDGLIGAVFKVNNKEQAKEANPESTFWNLVSNGPTVQLVLIRGIEKGATWIALALY